MQDTKGHTLAAVLEERRPFPLQEALSIFQQLLTALDGIHVQKRVHGDVNPANLLFTKRGVELRASRDVHPAYMSPEQHQPTLGVDARSDLYSAARVLHEMLTSGVPDEKPRGDAAGIPAAIAKTLAVALRPDARDRFPTARTFGEALQYAAVGFLPLDPRSRQDEPPPPRQPVSLRPPQRPRTSSTVSRIVIVLCVLGTVGVWIAPKRPVTTIAPGPPRVISTVLPPPARDPNPPQPDPEPRPTPETPRPSIDIADAPTPLDDAFDEEKRRREIDRLREAIDKGLVLAEQNMNDTAFDEAQQELDRLFELTEKHAQDLWQERTAIRALEKRLVAAIREDDATKAEAAQWEQDLTKIEGHLKTARFPEAKNGAEAILQNPRAPDWAVTRARDLQERAQAELKKLFGDTRIGPTNNTIRKPSSPRRN